MVSNRIDQLLFGYRDGHELLAGSVAIDARVQARLLPHTDARFEDDSEHYLVGVPAPELERFLLVRIWPAPEITRPGAVWAHALLIDPELLPRLDSVALAGCFRRPDQTSGFDSYVVPLDWQQDPHPVAVAPQRLALALSAAIYQQAASQSVIIWAPASDSETDLLAAWRRLPTSELSRFSFRTRGKARTGGGPYTLQIASALGGRSESEADVDIIDARHLNVKDVAPWVSLIAGATGDPDLPFAALLTNFAERLSDFRLLAELWPSVTAEDSTETITGLGRAYPEPNAMSDLKKELFGDARRFQRLWKVPEVERLYRLLEDDRNLLGTEDLNLRERVNALWGGPERVVALELVDSRQALPDASASLLIDLASAHLSVAELVERIADRPLVESTLTRQPKFLQNPDFWSSLSSAEAMRILDAAPEALTDKKVLNALLDADVLEVLNHALRDEAQMLLVATTLTRRNPRDLRPWERAFKGHEFELATALANASRVSAPSLVLAAAFLPVADSNRIDLRRWLPAARETHSRDDPVSRRAAAMMLSKALQSKTETARKVLIETFGQVHAALEDSSLSDRGALRELDRAMPDPKSGNRAKRLRKALIKNMERTDWSREEFERAVAPAGSQAKSLTKLVEKKHPLRRFLESAFDELTAPLRG